MRYNIVELNTAVKPFIAEFLFERDPLVSTVTYFDPDILIYTPLIELETLLQRHNILLTPHFLSTIHDDAAPSEQGILNVGVYNLGFIAMRRGVEVMRFLEWWKGKLRNKCLVDVAHGLFVDQLWVSFAPLYFENVYVSKHKGLNVAYWNLHERVITGKSGNYSVNNSFPLVFFHFSGYFPTQPDLISKFQNRFTFEQRPDLVPLFEEYREKLLANHYTSYRTIPCYYVQQKEQLEAEKQRIEEERIRFEQEKQRLVEEEYRREKERKRLELSREQQKLVPTLKRLSRRIINLF
jgi:hypothetical protein